MQPQDIGAAIRDAQLNLFQARDAVFLARCRLLAAEVCRKQGTVSINDIRARVKIPANMNPSVLGAVFKGKKFKAIGFTEASHPQAHARAVRVYKLTNNKE